MGVLSTVSDFLRLNGLTAGAPAVNRLANAVTRLDAPARPAAAVTYWYQGRCPQSDRLLQLPRTPLVEAIARGLMQQLAAASDPTSTQVDDGKMYGVLLVELPTGEQRVLKAFSGLLGGQSEVESWVPPLPGRGQVALAEARTLDQLEHLKQQLMALKQRPDRQHYNTLLQTCRGQLEALSDRHRDRKQQRQQQRQLLASSLQGDALTAALELLDQQSQQDGLERRRLKQQHQVQLQPLAQQVEQIEATIRMVKQQRKELSRQLQTQLHHAYWMTNFIGESRSLPQIVMGAAMPTGTGDCCAPKLLHYAATHQLTPLAMAEFWWGADSPNRDKVQGEFYGACRDRCQPLMGFLLAGLSVSQPSEIALPAITPLAVKQKNLENTSLRDQESDQIDASWLNREENRLNQSLQSASSSSCLSNLTILYEDDWLIAIDKPAGLLSVPGRYSHTQDSVLSRLQWLHNDAQLTAVHRLDQDTSGILLLARHRDIYRALSLQFQQRQVHKVYEALLAGAVMAETGVIDLPLWGDPQQAPYQRVDWRRGKPSTTHFRRMGMVRDYTRMELIPLTGRTHQLRIHAVDAQGLGVPIVGDRLYGMPPLGDRLYLHARTLTFQHPHSQQPLCLESQVPF